jgi:glucose/arabinose dehydrogenase
MRPRRALLGLALTAVLTGCGTDEASTTGGATAPSRLPASTSPPASSTLGQVRLAKVGAGFERPVALVFPPGGPPWVVEKPGRVVPLSGGGPGTPVLLDLSGEVSTGNEQGLLSIALDPNFADNGRVYADYTDTAGDTRVVAYRAENGIADPGSARVLVAVDQPYENHNGGELVFGPDGLLYIGLGDGGSAGDPQRTAQNPHSSLGKLLRLDVSDPAARPQIYALGLRNPWRFSFDRDTGDLWIGDVGQSAWEEVDRLPAGTPPGANFGWSAYEGLERYNDDQPAQPARLRRPVTVYGHDLGCSVTGGFVYRGRRVAALEGRYVFGDYCSGRLWTIGPDGHAHRLARVEVPALTSFAEDPDGELYALSDNGDVYRFDTGSPPP